MYIYIEKSIYCIEDLIDILWSGGRDVAQRAYDKGRGDELFEWIENMVDNGYFDDQDYHVIDSKINDYLWFDLENEPRWSNLWEDEEEEG